MKIYDVSNINKIYILSDIHGDFYQLKRHILHSSTSSQQEMSYIDKLRACLSNDKKRNKGLNNLLNNSVIIIAGDCGFGFNKLAYYQKPLNELNEVLADIKSTLFFVRGNHDDPLYFDGNTIDLSNIHAIPDYSIITTANDNILCVGGAVSTDRSWRISQENHINRFSPNHKKKLYWADEAPSFDEEKLNEIIESGIDIHFVISHSAPSFVEPSKIQELDAWEEYDTDLLKDIQNERQTLDDIYYYLINNNMPIKGWVFGHFHGDYYSKSKEYIPFRGLGNTFNFFNIYDILDSLSNRLRSSSFLSRPRELRYEPIMDLGGNENWDLDDVDEALRMAREENN